MFSFPPPIGLGDDFHGFVSNLAVKGGFSLKQMLEAIEIFSLSRSLRNLSRLLKLAGVHQKK